MLNIIIFLGCLAISTAQQGNLNTYEDIRAALIEGSEIQLNADSDGCDVSPDFGRVLVSMPMRHWQIIANENGETIESDDFYTSTPPGNEIAFILRKLTVFEDNSVEVNLSSSLNGTEPYDMICQLGDGANAHLLIRGNDLIHIDEYQEVKSRLLFGDHVEAIGNLNLCDNAADVLPPGVTIISGYQINRFGISNEATPDEVLRINDAAAIPIGLGQEALSVEQLSLYPDGSAVATIAVLSLADLTQILNITLECQIGTAFDFTLHQREDENTYATYQEVREATVNGHDMEVVVFLENCETLVGSVQDWTGVLASARFDGFQLFPPGGMTGNELEYLAFSTFGFNPAGAATVDVIRVYEDNSLTIEYFYVLPGTTQESDWHILSCPLETASVFHSVGRTRNPVNGYQQVIREIIEQGQIFEIEIDYGNCDTGEVQLDGLYGGIIWESYINPSNDGSGYYFGSVNSVVQQNVTGTPAPGWDAADIVLLPNDSALITPRLFDFFTGENLFPGVLQDPIVCELGNRPTSGVRMYRWP